MKSFDLIAVICIYFIYLYVNGVLILQCSTAGAISTPTITVKKFTILNDTFWKDDKPFQIIGGDLHYFRVLPQYWEDRLLRMKALGLNTIQTYVPWNLHEPRPNEFIYEGLADIISFLKLCQKMGFVVMLRAGPYICAEWDFGGLPPWLLAVRPELRLRSSDPSFIRLVKRWWSNLYKKTAPLLYDKGGPVIMVQIENEYGSYGSDKAYLRQLVSFSRAKLGDNVILYTTDGGSKETLEKGTLLGDDVFSAVDFATEDDPWPIFELQKQYNAPGKSPALITEFYTGWLTHWGEKFAKTDAGITASSLNRILSGSGSAVLYMAHGGTNFGFYSGANTGVKEYDYHADITSYDYDAPISEAGDVDNPKFKELLKVISRYNTASFPHVLPKTRNAKYGAVKLRKTSSLFDLLVIANSTYVVEEKQPLAMEAIGQFSGFVFYTSHFVTSKSHSTLFIPKLFTMEGESQDATNSSIKNKEKKKSPPTSQQTQIAKKSKPSNTSNKTSGAWEHFQRIEGSSDFPRAKCNYCGITYACDSQKNGTTNMLKHIRSKCKKYPGRINEVKQKLLSFEKTEKEGEASSNLVATTFSMEKCRLALAKLIIVEELPFRVVESEGFREYSVTLQPKFVVPSRTTVTRYCLRLYLDEKKSLKAFIGRKNLKVSLTTDTWTSIQNLNYMVLTSHFVDDDWKLQKRILNFCLIPNHKGETIGKNIEKCLLEWGIDSVLGITVDNASSNDVAINYLRRKLRNWNGTILDGEYLHVRCCAHILNLIVGDALKELHESIVNIRNAIRYVRSSPSRLAAFQSCVRAEKISSKNSLCLDVPTRWNSTYIMLDVAEKFQKAFERLEMDDAQYTLEFMGLGKDRRKNIPSSDDWENARAFTKFLKLFHDVTLRVSASLSVTSNQYFHEICLIQQQIQDYATCDNPLLCAMAKRMETKFNKYWKDNDRTNLLLYVAVVLDPRYKLEFVVFMLTDLYDENIANEIGKKVEDLVRKMYDEYKNAIDVEEDREKKKSLQLVEEKKKVVTDILGEGEPRARRNYLKFAQHLSKKDSQESKTEFDRYISEPCELVDDIDIDNNFDILAWWKVNSTKYKILAKMARDVFSIPISTVASESAFSTGGRVLDLYRSTLSPRTVQALVCTQNWICSTPIVHTLQVIETTTDHFQVIETEIMSGDEESTLTTLDD